MKQSTMLKITFYTAMFFLFIFKLLYCYNMNLNNFFQSFFLTFIFWGDGRQKPKRKKWKTVTKKMKKKASCNRMQSLQVQRSFAEIAEYFRETTHF